MVTRPTIGSLATIRRTLRCQRLGQNYQLLPMNKDGVFTYTPWLLGQENKEYVVEPMANPTIKVLVAIGWGLKPEMNAESDQKSRHFN